MLVPKIANYNSLFKYLVLPYFRKREKHVFSYKKLDAKKRKLEFFFKKTRIDKIVEGKVSFKRKV